MADPDLDLSYLKLVLKVNLIASTLVCCNGCVMFGFVGEKEFRCSDRNINPHSAFEA